MNSWIWDNKDPFKKEQAQNADQQKWYSDLCADEI